MEKEDRKPTRLKDYDYSQNGAYFVTVCTSDKKCILSSVEIVGEGLRALPYRMLSGTSSHIQHINMAQRSGSAHITTIL